MELTVMIVNIADAEEKHALSTPDGVVPAVGDQVDIEISGDAAKSFRVEKREFKFYEGEVNVVLLAVRLQPQGGESEPLIAFRCRAPCIAMN